MYLVEINICAVTRRLRRKNQPRRDLERSVWAQKTQSLKAWIGMSFFAIRRETDQNVWRLMSDRGSAMNEVIDRSRGQIGRVLVLAS